MRKLLKEISVIPGVAGSCIFDRNEGAVCADLEGNMPKDLTERVGIHFVRLVQMGQMSNLNIKTAHFRFDKYSVVGIPLEKGAILLAICEAQANCSLVATTATMLIEDMRSVLDQPLAPEKKEKTEAKGRNTAPEGSDAKLKPQLKIIEDALVEAIGPVGGMVMTDYFNKWRADGPADQSRLPELISMLVEEIGNAALAGEFRSQLKHLL